MNFAEMYFMSMHWGSLCLVLPDGLERYIAYGFEENPIIEAVFESAPAPEL